MGQALASAHALAEKDYDSAAVPFGIDSEVTQANTSKSSLRSEITTFAVGYADQVNLEWQAFKAAFGAGVALY